MLHAGAYLFRSPEVKRRTRLTAAFVLPEVFATGVVRAHLFPLRPLDKKRWDALLVVGFPVPMVEAAEEGAVREFGAVIRGKSSFHHGFSRSVTLRPKRAGVSASPTVTFVERVTLEPGLYDVTAVMIDPATTEPHSVRAKVEVPPIPRGELFVVRPVLGRTAGEDVVVNAGSRAAARGGGRKSARPAPASGDRIGSAGSFQPLLVTRLDEPQDLTALTAACVVGAGGAPGRAIVRQLCDGAGQVLGNLPAQPLEFEALDGTGKVRCVSLVDVLPRAALEAGEYTFDAVVQPAPEVEQAAIRAAGAVRGGRACRPAAVPLKPGGPHRALSGSIDAYSNLERARHHASAVGTSSAYSPLM